jgi:choice-of-anchor C domain-containing protein
MKLKSVALSGVVLYVLSLTGITSARASLVVDGGFTDAAGQSFITVVSPGTFGGVSGTAWAVTSGSVDIIGNYWQPPVTGQGSVDLDGNSPGAISQTLSGLVTGQTYALTFALSGNPDGLPQTKQVQVSINGQNQTFTFNDAGTTRPSPMNYAMESLTFTYNGTGNVLSFASLDDPSSAFGPVLGDVSVSAVPEASTWAMMILGFLGVGFMAYRRKGNTMELRIA